MTRILDSADRAIFEPVEFAEGGPAVTGISMTNARTFFSEAVGRAQGGPVVLVKGSRPIAVLISAEEYLRLRAQEPGQEPSTAEDDLPEVDFDEIEAIAKEMGERRESPAEIAARIRQRRLSP